MTVDRQINQYLLEASLGSGTYIKVYRAVDTVRSSATPIPIEPGEEDTSIRRKPANPGAIQGVFW